MDNDELLNLVLTERENAIGQGDELSQKRSTLIDYYNSQPYGDEIEGRSKFVSSDVSDTVEVMLPGMLRVFTQGRVLAKFESNTVEGEEEAEQKTQLANFVFLRQNQGTLILHNAIKDALWQYCGVVKVCWNDRATVTKERYKGLSSAEKAKLEADDEITIDEEESRKELVQEDGDVVEGTVYDVKATRTKVFGRVGYENIPPEEFLLNRDARDFVNPRFIGQRTAKRRSELIEMGFDPKIVNSLPADNHADEEEAIDRNEDISGFSDGNPTTEHANDEIYLTECYTYIDDDGDGITELHQVFEAGRTILQREPWDIHPFACGTPIPIPHRAIGTCPADQAADLQFTKSVLVRQMLDNIYNTNYQRTAYDENRVDLDDLLTPRPGGVVAVDGLPGDALYPLVTQPQIAEILTGIEYMDGAKEERTGSSRLNQGLDPDTLNKTATGFKGIMNASVQRQELMTRILADTLVKDIFVKTIHFITKYQDAEMQIKVSGKPLEIDPADWKYDIDCYVDVGLGSGDRNEKIQNLNYILQIQRGMVAQGMPLTDMPKMFNTLDKLVTEVGLKDGNNYFNDPEIPEELLQATVEIQGKMLEQMQQQMQQNPLAEAEMIKAQASLTKAQGDAQIDILKEASKNEQFMAKLDQDQQQFIAKLIQDYTKMELDSGQDVPDSRV